VETFIAEYTKQLRLAVLNFPNEYAYPVEQVPHVVSLMREAIRLGSFSKDSRAFKETCKVLGIKHTYKEIAHFIANHV